MEKTYNHQQTEKEIYEFWEKGGYFTPKKEKGKKPFTIILPPPNANAPLHMGHAMYVIEDILCRYHRMKNEPTLFLPGTDHAGIETQFVFEKKLKEEGKSRFDFDRQTLYQMIFEYVDKNRGIVREQMKKLGFSLDWTRERFTLEPQILETVFETFRKLHRDGLIYREEKIVNYCTFCGTSFSELEVVYVERDDYLYFLDYGPILIATTRPETIFADVAVAVNPKDKRYRQLVGKQAVVPLINKEIPIIEDELVQIDFGSGALKITPAHDTTDFEIGQRHSLPKISCISTEGKMINVPEELRGLTVAEARTQTIKMLEQEGKLLKIEPLRHSVGTCYRCKNIIEPLLVPQWFVKIKPLAQPAIEAVKKGKVKIFPPRFKKLYLDWMKNIKDWNISRQVVWGPRIPVWYCLDCNPYIKINFIDKNKKLVSGYFQELKENYDFEEIKNGLQTLLVPVEVKNYLLDNQKNCPVCGGTHLLQETDTFDTWFSSGQWPLTTLGYPDSDDFKYFYPTSVLDTMWDILFFWVARMIMLGIYLAKEVPFKVAHMHSRVVDIEHKKMSKSKGNVIDPLDVVSKYGADALRMALVLGTAPASDIVITEEKIISMRNFTNKIWNASRYLFFKAENLDNYEFGDLEKFDKKIAQNPDDRWIISELDQVILKVTKQIENYRFGQASETIYNFFWHKFCDIYIEKTKQRQDKEVLQVLAFVLASCLKLLHPFMPFVTEKVWSLLPGEKKPLVITSWPKS